MKIFKLYPPHLCTNWLATPSSIFGPYADLLLYMNSEFIEINEICPNIVLKICVKLILDIFSIVQYRVVLRMYH